MVSLFYFLETDICPLANDHLFIQAVSPKKVKIYVRQNLLTEHLTSKLFTLRKQI